MVDINLDLVIQGRLDLRIAGSIGLLEGNGQKRSGIQHAKRPAIQHSPSFLPTSPREQEAHERMGWDEMSEEDRLRHENESGEPPHALENRSQAGRDLTRAAGQTRRAMCELSKSMKSEDAQRIRRATERLREAVVRLVEEVRRRTAMPSEQGIPAA
jgi:hypothetical protein